VDNSKPPVDKSQSIVPVSVPNEDASDPEEGSSQSRLRTTEVPNEDQTQSQIVDIIEQSLALDSSRCILDSSRGQNRGIETYVSDRGTGTRTPEEHARFIREQIELAKAGKL
jgi:hypothetical protein